MTSTNPSNLFSKNPYIAIDEIKSAINEDHRSINWLGLAEVASGYATGRSATLTPEEKLKWGEIATLIRAYLVKQHPQWRENISLSDVLMRLHLMGRFGFVSGHEVLDPNHITLWFEKYRSQSLGEVRKIIDEPVIEVETILLFRKMIRRVSQLQSLRNLGYELSAELMEWLEIFPLLKHTLQAITKEATERERKLRAQKITKAENR